MPCPSCSKKVPFATTSWLVSVRTRKRHTTTMRKRRRCQASPSYATIVWWSTECSSSLMRGSRHRKARKRKIEALARRTVFSQGRATQKRAGWPRSLRQVGNSMLAIWASNSTWCRSSVDWTTSERKFRVICRKPVLMSPHQSAAQITRRSQMETSWIECRWWCQTKNQPKS